jgi:hypothetical protein
MISTKQRTIALSAIAIAAVIVLFASAPLIATHQAQAFWGGWGGWGGWGCWGGWCRAGTGGWFPWGPWAG